MNNIDIFVNNYFSIHRTPGVTNFFYVITSFFDLTLYFSILVLLVSFLIYLLRNKTYAGLFLTSLFSGAVLVYILKMVFDVARPLDGFMYAFGQSFPSFHATLSAIFFIMIMYIFDDFFSPLVRRLFNTFCIACLFLVSLSRVYLGVHWVSDVSFGILIACFISLFYIYIFKKRGWL